MGKLKVALSILALLLMTAATVTTIDVAAVPSWLTEAFEALGMLLAWLGYQPVALQPQVSRVFAVVSMMAVGFVGTHAAAWGDGRKHVALLVVAFVGAVAGALARGLANPAQPPALPKT
jgi:hypothetical protein